MGGDKHNFPLIFSPFILGVSQGGLLGPVLSCRNADAPTLLLVWRTSVCRFPRTKSSCGFQRYFSPFLWGYLLFFLAPKRFSSGLFFFLFLKKVGRYPRIGLFFGTPSLLPSSFSASLPPSKHVKNKTKGKKNRLLQHSH